jgi:hypothetical protein
MYAFIVFFFIGAAKIRIIYWIKDWGMAFATDSSCAYGLWEKQLFKKGNSPRPTRGNIENLEPI